MRCNHCDEEKGTLPSTRTRSHRVAEIGDIYPEHGCIQGMRFKQAERKAWGWYRFAYTNLYGCFHGMLDEHGQKFDLGNTAAMAP